MGKSLIKGSSRQPAPALTAIDLFHFQLPRFHALAIATDTDTLWPAAAGNPSTIGVIKKSRLFRCSLCAEALSAFQRRLPRTRGRSPQLPLYDPLFWLVGVEMRFFPITPMQCAIVTRKCFLPRPRPLAHSFKSLR